MKTDFWNTKLASRSKTTEKGMKFMRIYQHIDELTGPMLE